MEWVIKYVDGITDYRGIEFSGNRESNYLADTTEAFVEGMLNENRYNGDKSDLYVVYTPLHGTGSVPVTSALWEAGFCHVDIVEQ